MSDNNEVSILDILMILNEFKKPILMFSFIVAILAGFSTNFITPVYKATITVTPAKVSQNNMGMIPGLGGLAGLAGINLNSQSNDTQTSLAIFKSRRFIEEYIKEANLLPILFSKDWNQKTNSWKTDNEPSIRSGYGVYKRNLLVAAKGSLFDITISGSDPNGLAEMVNNSITRINTYSREQKIEEAERSIEYLELQLESTSINKSQDFLYNLIEEQTKSVMLANARDEYVFKVIDSAIVPTSKVSPIGSQYMILGFFCSFILSCFFALISKLYDINITKIGKKLFK